MISSFLSTKAGTLFQMMSGVPHQCHHISLVQRHTCFIQFTKTKQSKSLHLLPVNVINTFKIACLCYHCHTNTVPSYATGMLHKKPSHTRSSSYTMLLLNRPAHSKATLCDHLLSFASSFVWNYIPNVRCAPSMSSSKSCSQTYLFHSVYKD